MKMKNNWNFARKATAFLLALIIATATLVVASPSSEGQDESAFLPIRVASESLGAEVTWGSEDRSITIDFAGGNILLFADSQRVYINNEASTLGHSVFIANNTAFIHPDDFLYTLMRVMDVDMDSHLSETKLDAKLFASILMEELSIAGMIVAIVDAHEDFSWIQGFGYADSKLGIPVEEDTVFLVASISKTLTAIAVMQLVDDGIIDLDVPIVEYLPDFTMQPSPAGGDYRNITARMLLTHTAGILTQFHLEDIFDYSYISVGEHDPHFMNSFLYYLAQYYMESPEGEVFSYSNNGYVLLGVLVAALTGDDNLYDDFVRYTQENIFEAAGMTRSSFVLDDVLQPYLAQPYVDAVVREEYVFINGLPTGAMVSTGYDMARLMHILLNDDGVLLAPGTVGLMTQGHDFDFTDVGIEYGLGFARFPTDAGFHAVGHNGQWFHYNAYMVFDMESGIGIFVATNSHTGYEAAHFMALTLLQIAVAEKGV